MHCLNWSQLVIIAWTSTVSMCPQYYDHMTQRKNKQVVKWLTMWWLNEGESYYFGLESFKVVLILFFIILKFLITVQVVAYRLHLLSHCSFMFCHLLLHCFKTLWNFRSEKHGILHLFCSQKTCRSIVHYLITHLGPQFCLLKKNDLGYMNNKEKQNLCCSLTAQFYRSLFEDLAVGEDLDMVLLSLHWP